MIQEANLKIRRFKMARKAKVKKTRDGTVDKRTKKGKAIAARMAKARKAKNKPWFMKIFK
jgi:hypothetical protein